MSKHYVGEKVKWCGKDAVITAVWQDACEVWGIDFVVKGGSMELSCYDRKFDEINEKYGEEHKCSM